MKQCALLLTLLGVSSLAMAKLGPGDPPPDIVGRDLTGHEVELSEFAEKVVIITFWAAWCTPCLEELPILEEIQRIAGSDRVIVVAINLEGSRREFRRMARQLRDSPVIVTHDPRGLVSRQFGIRGIPYTALIGKSGRIAFVHEGFNDTLVDTLVGEVNYLLEADTQQDTANSDQR